MTTGAIIISDNLVKSSKTWWKITFPLWSGNQERGISTDGTWNMKKNTVDKVYIHVIFVLFAINLSVCKTTNPIFVFTIVRATDIPPKRPYVATRYTTPHLRLRIISLNFLFAQSQFCVPAVQLILHVLAVDLKPNRWR